MFFGMWLAGPVARRTYACVMRMRSWPSPVIG